MFEFYVKASNQVCIDKHVLLCCFREAEKHLEDGTKRYKDLQKRLELSDGEVADLRAEIEEHREAKKVSVLHFIIFIIFVFLILKDKIHLYFTILKASDVSYRM